MQKTLKVKPWGENQGDYVLINEADFDKSKHVKYTSHPKTTKKDEDDANS